MTCNCFIFANNIHPQNIAKTTCVVKGRSTCTNNETWMYWKVWTGFALNGKLFSQLKWNCSWALHRESWNKFNAQHPTSKDEKFQSKSSRGWIPNPCWLQPCFRRHCTEIVHCSTIFRRRDSFCHFRNGGNLSEAGIPGIPRQPLVGTSSLWDNAKMIFPPFFGIWVPDCRNLPESPSKEEGERVIVVPHVQNDHCSWTLLLLSCLRNCKMT